MLPVLMLEVLDIKSIKEPYYHVRSFLRFP
jgi:hypothetical protein